MAAKGESRMSASQVKTFKLIVASFHGNLEPLGYEVAKVMENGTYLKILGVGLKDDPTVLPQVKKLVQIKEGIEKCKTQFEGIHKTLQSPLKEDLRNYWSGRNEQFERRSSRSSKFQGAGDEKFRVIKDIIPKKISPSNLKLLYEEIKDNELYTNDFIIVLFERFSTIVISEIIMSKLPLHSIIHFIPCPVADLQENFPQLYNDIDFLKKSQEGKSVGIYIETLARSDNYVSEEYIYNFCNQFVYYLYDLEMIREQFIAYKTDFAEIDDRRTKILSYPLGMTSRNEVNDDAVVGVYLDNLYITIDSHSSNERRYSYMHLRPFLENKHGKIIVEDANKVLRSAIATQMNMMSYWRLIDILICSIKAIPFCPEDCQLDIELPLYYELLSWESLAQRLEFERPLYDEYYCIDLHLKCHLFIFRREFNKIVDVKTKYRLTTKLCFRDFCEYVMPDLVDIITTYNADMEERFNSDGDNQNQDDEIGKQKKLPMFTGLSFSDTLQELKVNDKIFRFEDGSISCSLENWQYAERRLSLEILLFGCSIYTHRWEGFLSRYPRIRIVTEQYITMDVDMQFATDYPNISIEWPNNCHTEYNYEDGAIAIQQRYHWNKRRERKRLYTPQGCILNYLEEDKIEILTPNGIIYMLYPRDYVSKGSDDDLKYFHLLTQANVADYVTFVRSLSCYNIECEHFDVTRSDGKKLRVFYGIVMEVKAQYLIYEWADYLKNERYADRDDGVKLLWRESSLECCYPCGTVITTKTVEDTIDVSCECRSRSTEDILRKINPALVEKAAQKSYMTEQYIMYNVTYIMQHEQYATVAFYNDDKVGIYSAEGIQVVISENDLVLIDLGPKLSLRVASGLCTIVSGSCIPEERDVLLKLCMASENSDILTFQNKNAYLSLNAKGEMALISKHGELKPYAEEKYFVSKRYKFGMEFISQNNYNKFVSHCPDNAFFYDSPTKTALFTPILTYDKQFSMPINNIEKDLNKFKTHCTNLKELPEESESVNSKLMGRVLAAKVIHKLESVPEDICSLVNHYTFIETTLGKNLEDALDYFLVPKVQRKNIRKWREKIKHSREDFEAKRRMLKVYNVMLQRNAFPKYHVFMENNGDIRRISLNKLEGK